MLELGVGKRDRGDPQMPWTCAGLWAMAQIPWGIPNWDQNPPLRTGSRQPAL